MLDYLIQLKEYILEGLYWALQNMSNATFWAFVGIFIGIIGALFPWLNDTRYGTYKSSYRIERIFYIGVAIFSFIFFIILLYRDLSN